MDSAERQAMTEAGAAAYARAEVYEKLSQRLPAAMLARTAAGCEDGTLLERFRRHMLNAESGGALGDEAKMQALRGLLVEEAMEVRHVLVQQEREAREFAVYAKGRLDGSPSVAPAHSNHAEGDRAPLDSTE